MIIISKIRNNTASPMTLGAVTIPANTTLILDDVNTPTIFNKTSMESINTNNIDTNIIWYDIADEVVTDANAQAFITYYLNNQKWSHASETTNAVTSFEVVSAMPTTKVAGRLYFVLG